MPLILVEYSGRNLDLQKVFLAVNDGKNFSFLSLLLATCGKLFTIMLLLFNLTFLLFIFFTFMYSRFLWNPSPTPSLFTFPQFFMSGSSETSSHPICEILMFHRYEGPWTTTLSFRSLSFGVLDMVANPDLDPQNLPPGPSGLKLSKCDFWKRIVYICVTCTCSRFLWSHKCKNLQTHPKTIQKFQNQIWSNTFPLVVWWIIHTGTVLNHFLGTPYSWNRQFFV